MLTGCEQQSDSRIRKGLPCMVVGMIPIEVSASSRLVLCVPVIAMIYNMWLF